MDYGRCYWTRWMQQWSLRIVSIIREQLVSSEILWQVEITGSPSWELSLSCWLIGCHSSFSLLEWYSIINMQIHSSERIVMILNIAILNCSSFCSFSPLLIHGRQLWKKAKISRQEKFDYEQTQLMDINPLKVHRWFTMISKLIIAANLIFSTCILCWFSLYVKQAILCY